MRTASGRVLGVVKEVIPNPANDLWVAVDDEGVETLVPALADLLIDVDVEARTIVVDDVPGLTAPEGTAEQTEDLEVGDLRQPRDLLQHVAMAVTLHKPSPLPLGEDAGHVLAAPAAEAREVGVGDGRDEHPVGREVVERRGHELEESLRDPALEIEVQEVVGEGLMLPDLSGERLEEAAGSSRLRGDEVEERLRSRSTRRPSRRA